nr:MAG TPA: hypothetical protein [Caudoviricetes sp.]
MASEPPPRQHGDEAGQSATGLLILHRGLGIEPFQRLADLGQVGTAQAARADGVLLAQGYLGQSIGPQAYLTCLFCAGQNCHRNHPLISPTWRKGFLWPVHYFFAAGVHNG